MRLRMLAVTCGLVATIVWPGCGASQCFAQFTSDNYEAGTGYMRYVSGDLHYLITQTEEDPMWLAIEQNDSHQRLKSVIIPSEINDVPGYSLVSDVRRAVVEKIGDFGFYRSIFPSIDIPVSVRRIGRCAFAASEVEQVNFSSGLVSIGERAFSNCGMLSSVKLPESLRYIEYGCFYMCQSLTRVDFPSTLQSLGGFTFRYTSRLTDIYCRAKIPPTADDSDFGVVYNRDYFQIDMEGGPDLSTCVLHVPVGSEELYRNAPGWKLFDNIVAIDESTTVDVFDDGTDDVVYYLSDNTVHVPCEPNDVISVYDAGGMCLESKRFSVSGEFRHSGKGVRLIRLNGKTAKVIL